MTIDMNDSGRHFFTRMRVLSCLVVLAIVSFATYYVAFVPPFLKTGTAMASLEKSKTVQMDGVQLKLGPNSKILSVNKRTIRLSSGWMDVAVQEGSSLRILTPQLTIIDKGGVFRVGVGVKTDYVIVKDGMVTVNKMALSWKLGSGRMLIARHGEDVWLATRPRANDKPDSLDRSPLPYEEEPGIPLKPGVNDHSRWNEALERLASRFPSVRWGGGYGGGWSECDGITYPETMTALKGLKKGFHDHFEDIALAAAGEKIVSGEWKFPVALIELSDVVSEPSLPGDIYLVQLVARKDKEIVWRFTGSLGSTADYPFISDTTAYGSGGGISGPSGSLSHSLEIANGSKSQPAAYLSVRLSDWPGKQKPEFTLKLKGTVKADDTVRNSSSQSPDATLAYQANHFPWAIDDPAKVAQLIKNGEDVNAMDKDGRTALHFAADRGKYETAKLLVEHGAKINVKEHSNEGCYCGWGWYPLHLALRNENKKVIRLLIDHGADVNAVRTDGWTPLHTAAYHGQQDIIALLIKKGANCKVYNSEPLRIAASQDQTEAAKLMIAHGADVNGKKIGAPEHEGKTPLFEAAYGGYIDMVKLLISKGAKVNTVTTAKISILKAAELGQDAFAGNPMTNPTKRHWDEVRSLLISKGAKG